MAKTKEDPQHQYGHVSCRKGYRLYELCSASQAIIPHPHLEEKEMSLEQQHRALAMSPHAGYGEAGALEVTASREGLQAPGNTQYLY